jgi:cytochrome c5
MNFSIGLPWVFCSAGLWFLAIANSAFSEQVDIGEKGKQVSETYCNACHLTGVIGAPRIGSKSDWEFRLQQGFGLLVQHALDGYRNMPAKGGNLTLSDEDIVYAVTYMLEKSQLDQSNEGVAESSSDIAVPAEGLTPDEPEVSASPSRTVESEGVMTEKLAVRNQNKNQKESSESVQQVAKGEGAVESFTL